MPPLLERSGFQPPIVVGQRTRATSRDPSRAKSVRVGRTRTG